MAVGKRVDNRQDSRADELMISKKIAIALSFLFLASLILIYFALDACWYDATCWDAQRSVGAFLPLAALVFLVSLLMYFMDERTYGVWMYFNYFSLPLACILIASSSLQSGGYVFQSNKALSALGVPLLYLVLLVTLLLLRFIRKK